MIRLFNATNLNTAMVTMPNPDDDTLLRIDINHLSDWDNDGIFQLAIRLINLARAMKPHQRSTS